MGCFSRFALFVLNFLIFGVGLATVILASIIISKNSVYGELLQGGTFTLPICVLIAGLIILLIGFFGCCGALKENSCMLQTYAAVVLLLFIAEVVLGILILVYREEAQDYITKGMKSTFDLYGQKDQSLTKSLDALQHEVHCCGVMSYKDWANFTFGKPNGDVAKGCCIDMTDDCFKGMAFESEEVAKNTIYTEGCYVTLMEDLKGVTLALGITVIILGLVQLMSVSCACGLAKNSKRYA